MRNNVQNFNLIAQNQSNLSMVFSKELPRKYCLYGCSEV